MSSKFRGRREDERLVTGKGRYTDDWNLPGQLFASFRRSDHAHAAIRNISVAAAEKVPGVVEILIGSAIMGTGLKALDAVIPFPGRNGQMAIAPEWPLLATDRVRFVGECVAMVVADSPRAAEDAAERIEIEYEDLPPVIGFDAALAPDATLLHSQIPGNVCFDFEYGDEEKTTELLAAADHRVRVTVESPRVAPTPLELRSALAWYEPATEMFEIRCAHQGAFALRDGLSRMMDVPAEFIRVNAVDVGGAFGARTTPFAEYPLMLHSARKIGKPIKWTSTRGEDFLTDNHGRAIRLEGELGLDSSGRFLALRTNWLCDSGAYLSQAGAFTNSSNGRMVGAGAYHVEALYGRHRQVMTNTAPTSPYRGAGRPEAIYIVERLVDEAATALGMDRLSIRERNAIRADQMPYVTHTGVSFDSGNFPKLIQEARTESTWDSFERRRKEALERGALRGIGCSLFLEPSGGGIAPKDEIAITFTDDGNIELFSVAGASGQGHETVFPELVAEKLGIERERVTLRAGDPDGPALMGSPAIGSRSALSHGSAFAIGALQVIEKGREIAADAMEVASADIEFADGRYTVAGTDRLLTLTQVMERAADSEPNPLNTVAEAPVAYAFPSGAHIAEIEVDPETGTVRFASYTAVDDSGTVLNETLAAGQVCGGIIQGAGQVFGEVCEYDFETGQMSTASFLDYVMPRADLLEKITLLESPNPSPTNFLGAKGAGEAGTTGALAACMSAVLDALRPAGVEHFDMPATPARLWAAIAAARDKQTST